MSHYDSREDLIAAVLASMFIPGWTRGFLSPCASFRGNLAIDGGFSDNVPEPPAERMTLENHWTIVDKEAPLCQVFSPPRAWHACACKDDGLEAEAGTAAAGRDPWASGVAMFLQEVAAGFEQARLRAGLPHRAPK